MKKMIFITLGVIIAGIVGIVVWISKNYVEVESNYQHDTDILRLNDLKVMGSIIDEYHQKTGKYPLQDNSETPNYVTIGTKSQMERLGDIPYEHKDTSVEEFTKILHKGLGRKIKMNYDPQTVGVSKPVVYTYMITGKTYFFNVLLDNDFSFANKLGEHYSKLEITNDPYEPGQWKIRDLLENPDFIKAAKEKPYRK